VSPCHNVPMIAVHSRRMLFVTGWLEYAAIDSVRFSRWLELRLFP